MEKDEDMQDAKSSLAKLGKRYRNEYQNEFDNMKDEFDHHVRRNKRCRSFRPAYDVVCENVGKVKFARCAGDLRLLKLRELLDSFSFTRTPDQIEFHEGFIKLCLPHIYGDDFETNRMRLMQTMNIASFKVGALVLTPRRWGKTTSVAMFLAAMMMVCEKVVIATFSYGQRASSGLMSKVSKFIYELQGGKERIVIKNEELLAVVVPSCLSDHGERKDSKETIRNAQQMNRLYAYPSSAEGLFLCFFVLIVLYLFDLNHNNKT